MLGIDVGAPLLFHHPYVTMCHLYVVDLSCHPIDLDGIGSGVALGKLTWLHVARLPCRICRVTSKEDLGLLLRSFTLFVYRVLGKPVSSPIALGWFVEAPEG
jgi:hypothetical protein